jgi:hypothetical protein
VPRTRIAGLMVVASFALGVGAAQHGSAASTASLSLTPVGDGTVSAATPKKNFGAAATLQVGTRPDDRSYLTFDLSGASGPVASAVLKLWPATTTKAGFVVRGVPNGSWSQDTLTYATRPAQGIVVARSGPVTAKRVVSLDVTKSVQAGVRSFVLLARPGTTALMLGSSESPKPGRRPVLAVRYTPSTGPCGWRTAAPAEPRHVIWIFMENKPYNAIVGSANAPYENELANQCGLATNYHAITHPSLPNYIAATSGGTQGVTDDRNPAAYPLTAESIYSQVKAAGKTWRDYEESSPGNCPQTSSGTYAVRHDPAAYYTGIRSDCALWDVPLGTTTAGALADDLANDALPAFSFITPNLCSDTHDCSVQTGDDWLRDRVPSILASHVYRSGTTVLVIVWDEDDGSATNHIAAIVVSPSTRPGMAVATAFDHYSLLKTTEQLLGISSFLGHAADPTTASMTSEFNLG